MNTQYWNPTIYMRHQRFFSLISTYEIFLIFNVFFPLLDGGGWEEQET